MRTVTSGKLFLAKTALGFLAVPLVACELLPQPCPVDLLNTAENRAKFHLCTCPPALKENPEHICCVDAGTCSEDSGLPDPETSDPAGDLSMVLNDLRTLPLLPVHEVCDEEPADVQIAWEYINIANGAVGDWTSYVQSEPELVLSEVGVAEIGRTPAGWSALDTAGVEPHNEEQELTPGSYGAFVDGLPVGVQNRGAVTSRTITSITSDSGRYDSLCGTGGGSG